MHKDWETAKDFFIAKFFKDNGKMREIAEKAYNGDRFSQEALAEWFEYNKFPNEAEYWKNKAMTNTIC